jgi:hypothetical protein
MKIVLITAKGIKSFKTSYIIIYRLAVPGAAKTVSNP